MPIHFKDNVFKRGVRPTLPYGSKCWSMRKTDEQLMHVTEIRILKWVGSVTQLDKIRNDCIRVTFKGAPIQEKLQENRLC